MGFSPGGTGRSLFGVCETKLRPSGSFLQFFDPRDVPYRAAHPVVEHLVPLNDCKVLSRPGADEFCQFPGVGSLQFELGVATPGGTESIVLRVDSKETDAEHRVAEWLRWFDANCAEARSSDHRNS